MKASLRDAPPERGTFFSFLIHERVGIFHEWKSEGREIRLFGLQPGGGVLQYISYTGMCPQRGRDFEAPDLERGIHFKGVF